MTVAFICLIMMAVINVFVNLADLIAAGVSSSETASGRVSP